MLDQISYCEDTQFCTTSIVIFFNPQEVTKIVHKFYEILWCQIEPFRLVI